MKCIQLSLLYLFCFISVTRANSISPVAGVQLKDVAMASEDNSGNIALQGRFNAVFNFIKAQLTGKGIYHYAAPERYSEENSIPSRLVGDGCYYFLKLESRLAQLRSDTLAMQISVYNRLGERFTLSFKMRTLTEKITRDITRMLDKVITGTSTMHALSIIDFRISPNISREDYSDFREELFEALDRNLSSRYVIFLQPGVSASQDPTFALSGVLNNSGILKLSYHTGKGEVRTVGSSYRFSERVTAKLITDVISQLNASH